MNRSLSRRTFCAGAATLLPAGTLLLSACGGGSSSDDAGTQATALGVHADVLDTAAPAQWADIALRAVALAPPPGLPPHFASRIYSMAFLAAHNALNAIAPVYESYLPTEAAPGASPDAAVIAAVYTVLVDQLPFAKELLDGEYAAALAAIRGGGSQPKGIATGHACAAAMLAARANDGLANAEGPYIPGTAPGDYRFTPPFDFAAEVNWGAVMQPFSITQAASYRVGAPYAITDPAYALDYNEVKSLGALVGSTRSADQSELAKFWLENTPDSWMKIALQLAGSRGMRGWELMRALALIEIAQVDAYTACFESKYFYRRWRPVTAIRLGDSDGNPLTLGDPSWTSFDPVCPPVPDYPSGHAASAGAGGVALAVVFGGDAASFTHRSVSLPGPTRSFTSFSQAQDEIGLSRICVGYHFRQAVEAGIAQGRAVATQVMRTQLPARA